jgi:hypothetical protein
MVYMITRNTNRIDDRRNRSMSDNLSASKKENTSPGETSEF